MPWALCQQCGKHARFARRGCALPADGGAPCPLLLVHRNVGDPGLGGGHPAPRHRRPAAAGRRPAGPVLQASHSAAAWCAAPLAHPPGRPAASAPAGCLLCLRRSVRLITTSPAGTARRVYCHHLQVVDDLEFHERQQASAWLHPASPTLHALRCARAASAAGMTTPPCRAGGLPTL